MIVKKDSTKQYEELLKEMIHKHCKTMQERLKRFPQKVVKDMPKLNIPDGEVMQSDGKEYNLKARANECTLVYDKLMSQANPSNYSSFLKNFKTSAKGKDPEVVKTIFNDFQAQLVKNFTEQKRELYDAVATMNAVVRWLKKDNKEKIKKNPSIDKEEAPTPTGDLTDNTSDVSTSDVNQSKTDEDEDFVRAERDDTAPKQESASYEEFEKWMSFYTENTIPKNGSFEPDYL